MSYVLQGHYRDVWHDVNDATTTQKKETAIGETFNK